MIDLKALAARVKMSRLLTEEEKSYWVRNLSRMTPEQLQKLDHILGDAEALPWSERMASYFSIATKAAAALAA